VAPVIVRALARAPFRRVLLSACGDLRLSASTFGVLSACWRVTITLLVIVRDVGYQPSVNEPPAM